MASQTALIDIRKEYSKATSLEKAFNGGIRSFKHYLDQLPERKRKRLINEIEKQVN
jgi:hypothetical protein